MLISNLKGLENLKKLKILSMQSNRITKLEGLDELKQLNQLYLSHNGIEKLEGLENNVMRSHSSEEPAFADARPVSSSNSPLLMSGTISSPSLRMCHT